MQRSRGALSRRRSGPSLLYPRSAVCIICTPEQRDPALQNDGWSRFAREGCVCSRLGRPPAARLLNPFCSLHLARRRPAPKSTFVSVSLRDGLFSRDTSEACSSEKGSFIGCTPARRQSLR